jgi:hypothetical protein
MTVRKEEYPPSAFRLEIHFFLSGHHGPFSTSYISSTWYFRSSHDPCGNQPYLFRFKLKSNQTSEEILFMRYQCRSTGPRLLSIGLAIMLVLLMYPYHLFAQAPDVTLTIAQSYIPAGGSVTYSITGAQPNSPIYWSSWRNGSVTENNAFYGHYTDANGNWSLPSDPMNDQGLWAKVTKVAGRIGTV